MRSSAPALLPIFRSQLQADILAALLLNPDHDYSLTPTGAAFPCPPQHRARRGKTPDRRGPTLRRREVGRSALMRANPDNRLIKPLAELLLLSWGPLQVVADELSGPDGPTGA